MMILDDNVNLPVEYVVISMSISSNKDRYYTIIPSIYILLADTATATFVAFPWEWDEYSA